MLDRLDEESQQKTTMTEIDLSTQLENVLIAFDRDALDRGQRESIEILNNPETNDQEESKILEQLFQETKQRQGI